MTFSYNIIFRISVLVFCETLRANQHALLIFKTKLWTILWTHITQNTGLQTCCITQTVIHHQWVSSRDRNYRPARSLPTQKYLMLATEFGSHMLWIHAVTYIFFIGLMCRWWGRSVARDSRGAPCSRGGHAPRHWWDREGSTGDWRSSGCLGTSSGWRWRNRTPTSPGGSKKESPLWRIWQGRTCKCYPILKALTFSLLFEVSYNSGVFGSYNVKHF